jgi:hypothetical protein
MPGTGMPAVLWADGGAGSSADSHTPLRPVSRTSPEQALIKGDFEAARAHGSAPVPVIGFDLFLQAQDQILRDLYLAAFCLVGVPFHHHNAVFGQALRAAFDAGFVAIPMDAEADGVVFLRSDAVTDAKRIGLPFSGQVCMSSLGSNGRFAKQLFQYI